MSITIDEALAVKLLERAVEERGADYIYEREVANVCTYVSDGAPSCLVGHVINYVAPELMPSIAAWEITTASGTGVGELVQEFDSLEISPRALQLLATAQQAQDDGASWGRALAVTKSGEGW